MPKVEIVYQPRVDWPQSVLDLLKKANEEYLTHNIQLCRDSVMYGEGCPIANCRCTCHEAEPNDEHNGGIEDNGSLDDASLPEYQNAWDALNPHHDPEGDDE